MLSFHEADRPDVIRTVFDVMTTGSADTLRHLAEYARLLDELYERDELALTRAQAAAVEAAAWCVDLLDDADWGTPDQRERIYEVKVGDEVAAGFIVRNSEVGSGALAVEPYLHRLACVNGMVVPVGGLRMVHLGRAQDDMIQYLSDATLKLEDRAYMAKVRDVLGTLVSTDGFERILATARGAAGKQVENPIASTEMLASAVGLREPEQERLLANLTTGGDLSVWGMLNALTATARDLSDYDRKVELETAAGKLMFSEKDVTALAKAA